MRYLFPALLLFLAIAGAFFFWQAAHADAYTVPINPLRGMITSKSLPVIVLPNVIRPSRS